MQRLLLSAVLVGSLLVGSYGFAQDHHHGHGVSDVETRSIVDIMQGMSESLHSLTSAILFQDYPLIVSSARGIANHPGIAQEDLHVLFERLGPLKEAFIACDESVHQLAKNIAEAGEQEDMDLVLEKYAAMIGKTVECHRNYRPDMKVGSEK